MASIAAALLLSSGQRGKQIGPGTSIQPVANSSDGNKSTQISNDSNASRTTIELVSLPSATTVVQGWVAQYNAQQNKGIVSASFSRDAESPKNMSELFSSSSADLAVVGNVPDSKTSGSHVFLVPVSPHAVAVVYNIPGFPDVSSGLKLNATTLASVFRGNITYWDDAAIKAPNPDLNLPHERIVLVHLGKDDSSADLLDRYLSPGANGSSINWAKSSTVVQSVGDLSTTVEQTPFSIGQIDYAYAVQTKMTYGALQNSRGNFVLPTLDSISSAVRNGTRIGNATVLSNVNSGNDSLLAANIPRVDIPQIGGNSSYPVVGFYDAAFANRTGMSNATSDAVKDFAKWMAGIQGQRVIGDAQYPAIYDTELMKTYLKQKLG